MPDKHKVLNDMGEEEQDAIESSDMSNWTNTTENDADLDELFLSDDTITLTLEQVDMLMDSFYSQQDPHQTTEYQMADSPLQTSKLDTNGNIPSSPLLDGSPENDDNSLTNIPRQNQLDQHAVVNSIAAKLNMVLDNSGPLASVNLKDLILEISKIWTKEDRQKLISQLPSEDIINGDIRPDFFSDKNSGFWNQLKEFERYFFSNEYINNGSGHVNT